MSLSLSSYVGDLIDTNAYLVVDDETKTAIVVDVPRDTAEQVVAAAKAAGTTVTQIVVTHTHWDHVGDAAKLKELTGAPISAHRLAVDALAKPGSSTMELPFTIPAVTPDRLLEEGDEIELGDHRFQVMHLPGHDPSHIALYSGPDLMFIGGDVLFPAGHGRTDIAGADQATMDRSLARLAVLPPATVVYPGHGRSTTIGAESWLQAK